MFQRLSVILLLLSAVNALAQERDDSRNQLTVAVGAIHTRFVDEAFSHSRLRFAGTAFVPAAGYERKFGRSSYFLVSLQGSKGQGTSRHLPAEAEVYHYQLSFPQPGRMEWPPNYFESVD